MAYRSYCVTIRPRDGISDYTVGEFTKYFKKLDYVVAVLEMEDDARHLHAQIWFDTEKTRGDIAKQFQRICERSIEDFDRAQLKVLRSAIRIAYSDWYLDYLLENPDKPSPNIIINKPPRFTMEFYPTEEEQEAVKQKCSAVDPFYHDLKVKFLQQHSDEKVTTLDVAQFLHSQQHIVCEMKVIRNQRDARSMVTTLYQHITQKFDITFWLDKDTQNLHQCLQEAEQLKCVQNEINNILI